MNTDNVSVENSIIVDGLSLPTLYKKNSKGKIQYWHISVIPNPDHSTGYDIYTTYGQKGGKEQETFESIFEGKNIGKANETTPKEQAEVEAKSRWTKQIERKGYVENIEDVDKDLRPGAEPMLAHRFDKYPDKINYPCAIQPKLDGHRCIAVYDHGNVELFSRQRKKITGLPHIENAIKSLLSGAECKLILDGELYNHDFKHNFEKLTSHIRNEEPKEGHEIVQYHVYDAVVDHLTYKDRHAMLRELLGMTTISYLYLVNTQLVEENEVLVEFKKHRDAGYEGSILRNLDSLYEGKRSYGLQKVKEFCDDEFKIVGVEEGRGKMKGHAIFVCETHEGKEFKAKMKGSMESLGEYFKNSELYIGKIITVQFQDYTKDGIPRFPVAVRFREDA